MSLAEYPAVRTPETLGPISGYAWESDPRHLVFTLARYKFVAKMLSGRADVAEIGCGDGFASRIVQQEVRTLTLYDAEPAFAQYAASRETPRWPVEARVHDLVLDPLPQQYDALYSLDVLEHIRPRDETAFLTNMRASLTNHGIVVIGTPSAESQEYAAPHNLLGHVNCKTGTGLRGALEDYFHTVLLFSMNDEMVHTGFAPMAHYLFVVCCDARA